MKKLFTLLAMVGLAFASCVPGGNEPGGNENGGNENGGSEVVGGEFEFGNDGQATLFTSSL